MARGTAGYKGYIPSTNPSGVWTIQEVHERALTGDWPPAISVEYLVVAGGGGGARGEDLVRYSGGGGGGSHLSGTLQVSKLVSLTIGAGGAGATDFAAAPNGSNSNLGSVAATGGGGAPGVNGGTGGTNAGSGGTGGNPPTVSPGSGTTSSITGTALSRSGGGGASRSQSGVDGGGNGGAQGQPGTNGAANRGGGGGGGDPLNSQNGGSGGSGVVILRYPDTYTISNPGGGLTFTTATDGSDKITTFTAGTGNIEFA